MEKEISSIRLVSSIHGYGPSPESDEAYEQFLTIARDGRIWFSERTFGQACQNKGFCRKEQMNIGAWKAGFLLELMAKVPDNTFAYDAPMFSMSIRYKDGSTKEIDGSVTGIKVINYIEFADLSQLMRRYIPVNDLWCFGGHYENDFDGREAIGRFASGWRRALSKGMIAFGDFARKFGNDCAELGFQMDSAGEFTRLYPRAFPTEQGNIHEVIDGIQDIDLLGSAVFSQWRYLTHWSDGEVNENDYEWLITVLGQMEKLTVPPGTRI